LIQIRKILENAINSIDTNFYWKTATPVFDDTPTLIGYKLNSCDTLHLRRNATIFLAGEGTFTIEDFSLNEWVQIAFTGDIDTLPKTATTRPIYFDFGTLKDTEMERSWENKYNEANLPMLWLRTPISSTIQDEMSSIDTLADLEFFVLDYCYPIGAPELNDNTKIWLTKEHQTEVVEPMENLFRKRILQYFKDNRSIFSDLTETTIDVRGRVFISQEDEDGGTKTLFNENLSGVQVRMELGFNKNLQCNC
jgi:hypothetical protein